jgi:16S rRNA (guanine(966)-N(2))-methyltransferase RsmD
MIKPPKNFRARPTTDFARESLFNVLNNYIDFEGLRVLDLFSGTGSIGMEFASRGAAEVEMVEKNFIHSEFIKKTILQFGMAQVRVVKSDAFNYIESINRQFDLVFADPPYDMENFERVPEKVLSSKVFSPDAWFVLEHSASYDFSKLPGFFQQRKYGSVNFSFFRVNQVN